jgi:hypothetical protein
MNQTAIRKAALAALIVVACALAAVVLATATAEAPRAAESTPSHFDPLKIAGAASSFLSSIAVIFGALTASIKTIREWVVKKVRKALRIVDIEEALNKLQVKHDEDMAKAIKDRHDQMRNVTDQTKTLEDTVKDLTEKIDKLNDTLIRGQSCDRALIRESITRLYFKHHKTKSIPVNEREQVSQLHALHLALGNEPYIQDLMDELRTWRIVYPEHPSRNDNEQ